MLINQVAKLSGVTKDTVRLYTEKGIIHCHRKQAGSRFYADYDKTVVELVKGIKIMQSIGFTLAEIKPLADEYSSGKLTNDRQRIILETKLAEIKKKKQLLGELEASIQKKLKKLI